MKLKSVRVLLLLAFPAVAATAPAQQVIYVAGRVLVTSGDSGLHQSFTMAGGSGGVLNRAVGPTLTEPPYLVEGMLPDPVIEVAGLDATGELRLVANDNWDGDTTIQAVTTALGAFEFISDDSLDAATLNSWGGGVINVVTKSSGETFSVGYVFHETYAVDFNNGFGLSTLQGNVTGPVQFAIVGSGTIDLMLRVLGPSSGLPGSNPDPELTISQFDGVGYVPLASNDDWSDDRIKPRVSTWGLPNAPDFSKDSGLIFSAGPGIYAAEVTKGTGRVRIEIVNLGATPPLAGAPEITSARTARIGVLQEFNYAITATNTSRSFVVSGLPSELEFDPATGVISGQPLEVGVFPVTMAAGNANGSGTALLNLNTFAPLDSYTFSNVAGRTNIGSTGGDLLAARFNEPSDLTKDADGNIYVPDPNDHVIRMINKATGNVTIVAGEPGKRGSPDATTDSGWLLRSPVAVAVNAAGTALYVGEPDAILEINLVAGTCRVVAGERGVPGSNNGIGSAAHLSSLSSMLLNEPNGLLYFGDASTVRRVDLETLEVSTFASGFPDKVQDVAFGPTGSVFASTAGFIFHISPGATAADRTVSRVAGNPGGELGDGPALERRIGAPAGMWYDPPTDLLYFSDELVGSIRYLDALGNLVTLAGPLDLSVDPGYTDGAGSSVRFYFPRGIVLDDGEIKVADSRNAVIRAVDVSTGNVTTYAGKGPDPRGTVEGVGAEARLGFLGFAETSFNDLDSAANLSFFRKLYFPGEHDVWGVDVETAEVERVAGTGEAGSQDGTWDTSTFGELGAVWVDLYGNILVYELDTGHIRKVGVDDTVTTVSVPDSTPLTLSDASHIAAGRDGSLYATRDLSGDIELCKVTWTGSEFSRTDVLATFPGTSAGLVVDPDTVAWILEATGRLLKATETIDGATGTPTAEVEEFASGFGPSQSLAQEPSRDFLTFTGSVEDGWGITRIDGTTGATESWSNGLSPGAADGPAHQVRLGSPFFAGTGPGGVFYYADAANRIIGKGEPSLAPVITNASTARGEFGESFFLAVTTSSPAPNHSATGLPPGLSINALTGSIDGFPTEPGTFEVHLTVANEIGMGEATLTITIDPAQVPITVTDTAHIYDGTPKPVTASAGGHPVTVTYDGNPTPPTGIGTYVVEATVNETNYTGREVAILLIAPAEHRVTYTGRFSDTGYWDLRLDPGGATGVFVGHLPSLGSALVTTVPIMPDGTFTVSGTTFFGSRAPGEGHVFSTTQARPAASVAFTLVGQIHNGMITGSLPGLDITLFGSVSSPAGDFADIAGLYVADALLASSGTTFAIVDATGQVRVVTATADIVDAGTGTIDSNGHLAVKTETGTTIDLTIDAGTQSFNVAVTPDGAATPISFSGLAATVTPVNRLVNISTRGFVGVGAQVLIEGFIIEGPAPKSVLLRGVGPGLAPLLPPGDASLVLSDPRLELYRRTSAGEMLHDSNDSWDAAPNIAADLVAAAAQTGAFALASGSADAALLAELVPGAYTVVVQGRAGATGIALAEVYELPNSIAAPERLINISTRGQVNTGAAIMIAGFVVTGNAPKRMLIRGIGPGLAALLNPDEAALVLTDPEIELFDSGAVSLRTNDDWGSDGDAALISDAIQTTGAFAIAAGSKDAVLLLTLAPGQYTVHLRGVGGTTGIALVEVYEAP